MEWFKRAPGIKIFLVVWLVVALIPILRLRAVRQWQNAQGLTSGTQPLLEFGFQPGAADAYAKAHPHDLDTKLELIGQLDPSNNATKNDGYFKKFAALASQYPNQLKIRSEWLREAASLELPIETEAQLRSQAMTRTTPPRVSISQSQLEAALDCATYAAHQEPGNAYWPWMESVFAFSLHREGQAVAALAKAGTCSRFDDGTTVKQQRSARLLRQSQLQDIEDQVAMMSALQLPHLGKLRATARAAMWVAGQSYQRGNKHQAFQIVNDLQRAGFAITKTKGTYITRLVGKAIVSVAWEEGLKMTGVHIPKRKLDDFDEGLKQKLYKPNLLAAFTSNITKAGYHQVAKQAQAISIDLGKRDDRAIIMAVEGAPSMRLWERFDAIVVMHWLGSWLIKLSFYGAFFWLLAFTFTRRMGEAATPLRRSMATICAFCLGISVAYLWYAIRAGVVPLITTFGAISAEGQVVPFFLTLIWSAPILVSTIHSQLRSKTSGKTAFGFWSGFGLAIFMVVSLISYALTLVPPGGAQQMIFNLSVLIIVNVSLLLTTAYFFRRTDSTTKACFACAVGAFICFTTFFFLIGVSRNAAGSTVDGLIDVLGVVACVLALLGVGLGLKAGLFKRILRSDFIVELLQRVRIASAAIAVLAAIGYVGLTLYSFPIRRQVQSDLDRRFELGEVGHFEELMKESRR